MSQPEERAIVALVAMSMPASIKFLPRRDSTPKEALLSLPKMLCGVNAFKISDHQLDPR